MPTLEELRQELSKAAEEKAGKPDPVDSVERHQLCEMCSDTQGVFNHRGHRIPCPTCLPPVIRFGAAGVCMTCEGAEEVRDPKRERWPCPTCQDPVPPEEVGEILKKAARVEDIRNLSDGKLMEYTEKLLGTPADIGQEMCVCAHWNIDHDIRPGKPNRCDHCSCVVFEKAAKCASCNGSGLDPDRDDVRCTGPCRPSGGNGYICERKEVNAAIDVIKILAAHDHFNVIPKLTGMSVEEYKQASRKIVRCCRVHECTRVPKPGRAMCDEHWKGERYCEACRGLGVRMGTSDHDGSCGRCNGTGRLCSHCGNYARCDFCRVL